MSRNARRDRRLSWAKLGLAAGGALAAALLVEVAIRIVEAMNGPIAHAGLGNPLVRPHPVLRMEHRAGVRYRMGATRTEYPQGYKELRTNNLGLRADADTSIEKPAGTYRVLVLGDSQTEGYVENRDGWPAMVGRWLNQPDERRGGDAVEVLNAGVITYSPMNEYLWWRLYGRDLHPDLVVLGYFVGNDLLDAEEGRLQRRADGGWDLDESPQPLPEIPLRSRLLLACRACALLRSSLDSPTVDRLLERLGVISTEQLVVRQHGGCLWDSLHQTRVLLDDPLRYQARLDATEEILRRLTVETGAAGARFLVVIIPSKIQIEDDAEARHVADLLGIRLPAEPFENRVARDVRALCEKLGIAVASPRAELAAARGRLGEPLYYESDWHLNVLGNRLLAESDATREAVRALRDRKPADGGQRRAEREEPP